MSEGLKFEKSRGQEAKKGTKKGGQKPEEGQTTRK
jgi:hypothetical protein